jgi:hypothetical protein
VAWDVRAWDGDGASRVRDVRGRRRRGGVTAADNLPTMRSAPRLHATKKTTRPVG